MHTAADRDGLIVILSGAGLSAASGVPTFRDADGLWEGHAIENVATPEAFDRDPTLVRKFYDDRREHCARVVPNDGHRALARLQQQWGAERVVLITQNVDGLLTAAGCADVIEMHGSLWRLRCAATELHPSVDVRGRQDPSLRCALCHSAMRPDIVWFGEVPVGLERIERATRLAHTFVSVGTSGLVYPAAGLVGLAKATGATTIEINPQPAGGPFDHIIAEGSETALPRLVEALLAKG